jgi:two-component system sensor histidine kinase ChiS
VLDLRGWRFAEDGPVRLDGAWTFFWQQHLRTEAFLSPTPPQATGLITLPGTWNGYKIDGKKLEGFGFATYPLVILIDDPIGRLALKFQDMSTATAVYVNGKRLIVSGKPGTSPDNSTPHFIPQVR